MLENETLPPQRWKLKSAVAIEDPQHAKRSRIDKQIREHRRPRGPR